jgi:hypothetical protein
LGDEVLPLKDHTLGLPEPSVAVHSGSAVGAGSSQQVTHCWKAATAAVFNGTSCSASYWHVWCESSCGVSTGQHGPFSAQLDAWNVELSCAK